MDYDESSLSFDAIFNRLDARENQGLCFKKDLNQALYHIIITHWPNLLTRHPEWDVAFKELAEEFTHETFDSFDYVYSLNDSKYKIKNPLAIPNIPGSPDSYREAEKLKLDERLKTIPADGVELFSKIFWDSFNRNLKKEAFVFAVFNKMKELLAQYYVDDIVNFDGIYMRELESYLFHHTANNFAQAFYTITSRKLWS